MTLRVVAIPLFAAILATPALSYSEQVQKGRGFRDRGGDGSSGGTAQSGGDNPRSGGGSDRTADTNNRPADRRGDTRTAERRAEPRSEPRVADGDRDDRRRVAVPRDDDGRGRGVNRRRDDRPVIVSRNRPDININIGNSYRGRYYAPVHYDAWARRYYRWSPIRYAPWSLIYGAIGLSNYGYYGPVNPGTYSYGAGGYYGGGYGPPWQAGGYDTGAVRLRVRPRYAEVYVDGYYAGLVDDFDGTFQSLRLPAGGHRIEIHLPGYTDLEIDVHVQPGRTLTLAEDLRPSP